MTYQVNEDKKIENTYNIIIGGTNKTLYKWFFIPRVKRGIVDIKTVENVLNNQFEGFTISAPATGYWQGKKEQSITVTFISTEEQKNDVVRELNTKLDQDAIAVQKVAELIFEDGRQ